MVLVALTIAFFVAMLTETPHDLDWKSSILQLMAQGGLEEHSNGEDEGHLASIRVMEKSAEGLRVQPDSAGKCWKFKKAA